MVVNSQRLAERRSLALHRRVAERLREDPELLNLARRKLAAWLASDHASRTYLRAWEQLMARPLDDLIAVLVEDSEAARELRGASPFVGIVTPRERWHIWKSALLEQCAERP